MTRLAPALAAVLLATGAASADGAAPSVDGLSLSLEACVDEVVTNDPAVRAAEQEARAAGFETASAWIGILPSLSLSAARSRSVADPKPATTAFAPIALLTPVAARTEVPPLSDRTSDSRTGSVSASWNLFGGGEALALRSEQHARARALAEAEIARRRSAMDAAREFVRVHQTASLLAARERDVERRALALERAQALVARGRRPRVDELTAKAEKDAAIAARAEAAQQHGTASARLRNLLRRPPASPLALADAPDGTPPVVALEDLSSALEAAWTRRPERVAAEAVVGTARASRLRAGETMLPRIDATVGKSFLWDGATYRREAQGWNASLTATFGLTGLLRSGFATGAADARVRSALERLEDARRAVSLEVEQARLSLVGAVARAEASESAHASAKEAAEAFAERYRLGLAQIVELKDAEARLSQAASDRVAARGARALAAQEWAHATGAPLPWTGEAR